MDIHSLKSFIIKTWDSQIIPALQDFIRIPNKSPAFDRDWEKNGYMQQAVDLIKNWCIAQEVAGMQLTVLQSPGRTPLIVMDIPGQHDKTILLYGHLDKQPEMVGWDQGLAPWQPVIKDDKLYGRGGADDGYAAFACVTAIKALQQQAIPHARCVILIEASEESGSFDLPFYMNELAEQLGTPDLIICLDSGCGNYEQLWSTTSLRGIINGNLTVELLSEGVHSGYGSGIYASSFRVIRQLLSRIENQDTGEILLKPAYVDIPADRLQQTKHAATSLGAQVYQAFPALPGVKPVSTDITELLLNRNWRPQLSIIGAAGLPPVETAGNVLRAKTTLTLSLRIPPTCDAKQTALALKACLEANPPYQAKVTFEIKQDADGWNAPLLADWLATANQQASLHFYNKPAAYMGEGYSIPFMAMLGEYFPQAQFLIAGVLGPHSNAHGPNEFLHIPMAKNLTCCIAYVIAEHFKHVAS